MLFNVAVTVAALTGTVANACHTSAAPNVALTRFASVHCRPPPVTDMTVCVGFLRTICLDERQQSSLPPAVVIAGAVNLPAVFVWSADTVVSSVGAVRGQPTTELR